ncbi:hypothetical protein [Streptomyces mangrovisoli]|uniref:Uncharacterized protein n=1 Tax=Streptomyces mangrovisoli TaxID=1428628 RepID=A0A1J4P2F3_9ACTN|nr:hypothetical protein [Streptomyces mangrovisoli]OIJ68937.1 hypothetical protein WN71_005625 [Streptomyces mangrovisoli]
MTEIASPFLSHPRVLVLGPQPGKPGTKPFRIVEVEGEVVGQARTVTDVLEIAAEYGVVVHDLDDPNVICWVGGDRYTWQLH